MKASKFLNYCLARDSDILSLQDRDHGDRLNLAQIQKLVDEDTDMQQLPKARQKEYIDDLQAHRDSKTMGARASNVAAAVDCRTSIGRVSSEVCIFPKPPCAWIKLLPDQKPLGAHRRVRLHIFHAHSYP
jgi:hypothetical protein